MDSTEYLAFADDLTVSNNLPSDKILHVMQSALKSLERLEQPLSSEEVTSVLSHLTETYHSIVGIINHCVDKLNAIDESVLRLNDAIREIIYTTYQRFQPIIPHLYQTCSSNETNAALLSKLIDSFTRIATNFDVKVQLKPPKIAVILQLTNILQDLKRQNTLSNKIIHFFHADKNLNYQIKTLQKLISEINQTDDLSPLAAVTNDPKLLTSPALAKALSEFTSTPENNAGYLPRAAA